MSRWSGISSDGVICREWLQYSSLELRRLSSWKRKDRSGILCDILCDVYTR